MAHSENLHAESYSFDYLLQTRVNINCAIYPEQKKKKEILKNSHRSLRFMNCGIKIHEMDHKILTFCVNR